MQRGLCLLLNYSFFIALFLLPSSLFANFDFNSNCFKAYQNIFELKLNNARQLIALEKKNNPNNAIVPLLENYIDYFYLLTNESKTEFERLETKKAERLLKISHGDKDSPYYLYAQAEINLQWALIRARYGSYYLAAKEINRAQRLLLDNRKKFPGFHLNNKGLGLINSVIGVLPDGFLKSTLATFGIHGDTDLGLKLLDQLAENLPKSAYEPFYEETVFYYTYVLVDVVKSPLAYAKTMKFTARISDSSLLKNYLQAYVCFRNGKNDQAIEILSNKAEGPAYQAFPYLDYLMGVAKLNQLDLVSSEAYFNKFLQSNKGTNYIKSSYLHLAWIAFLKGELTKSSALTAKARASGFLYHERDKQAQSEAAAPIANPILLKARLLFDGGYLNKALALLLAKAVGEFDSVKDQTEYYYRLGRIYDDLGKDELAIMNYQNTIATGKNLKYYYAARAALLSGKLYEKKKNMPKAKQNFNIAINMKGHEYENSIEAEAKLGLKRLGG